MSPPSRAPLCTLRLRLRRRLQVRTNPSSSLPLSALKLTLFDAVFSVSVYGTPYFAWSLSFLIIPFFVSLGVLAFALMHLGSNHLVDRHAMTRSNWSWWYSIVLILAATKLDVLVLLPFTKRTLDGFPSMLILRLTFITIFMEDVPQAVIQTVYISEEGASVVPVLSLTTTVLYLLVACMRRWAICTLLQEEEDMPATGSVQV